MGARSIPARHGGVEQVVEALAAEYVQRGHDVTAFVSEGCDDLPGGPRVERVRTVQGKYLQAPVQALSSALRVGHEFDVAHVHGIGPGVAVPLLQARGIPTVLTVHALDFERAKWPPAARQAFRRLSRPGVRRADRVLSVAHHLARDVDHEYGVRPIVVPNGVRAVRRPGANERLAARGLHPRSYLLFVGRLVPEKRVDLLLEAYAASSMRMPLVVVGGGEGSYAGDYEERLHAMAPAGVHFLGPQPHEVVCDLVSGAAMLVNPSNLEGLPLTVLEARVLGTPVVLSDIAPHRELAGRSSQLFPHGDRAALAVALDRAGARLPGLLAQAAAEVPDVATTYSWCSVAGRTLDIYRELLEARGRARIHVPATDVRWRQQPVDAGSAASA